jgi:hypothetical protein
VWLLGVLVIMFLSGAYAVVVGDLRDRRRLLARLKQAANHDALTGCRTGASSANGSASRSRMRAARSVTSG